MYATLLRLGLWIVILVLALYVVSEAYPGTPVDEFVTPSMLQQALVVGIALIIAGIVAHLLGKGAAVAVKNRCTVCRSPIPTGAIYCRQHLRSILQEEDERLHQTRVRR